MQPLAQTDANAEHPALKRRTIEVVPRGEFLREFGSDYQSGQHVTLIGPTQRGKTTLSHEMLGQVISPEHKAVILAGKPPKRDSVMGNAATKLNLRIVEEWPPVWTPKDKKRNGYVLRPYQSLQDLDKDEANVRAQFKAAMMRNYSSDKPVITVVDEAHHVQNDLKLRKEYEAPLMRGAPVNAEWTLMQRNRYMSYHAYSAPEHVLIFWDPDISNVKRDAELVGGVDPRYVAAIVTGLKRYRVKTGGTISEALYIKRSGDMYVVSVN